MPVKIINFPIIPFDAPRPPASVERVLDIAQALAAKANFTTLPHLIFSCIIAEFVNYKYFGRCNEVGIRTMKPRYGDKPFFRAAFRLRGENNRAFRIYIHMNRDHSFLINTYIPSRNKMTTKNFESYEAVIDGIKETFEDFLTFSNMTIKINDPQNDRYVDGVFYRV